MTARSSHGPGSNSGVRSPAHPAGCRKGERGAALLITLGALALIAALSAAALSLATGPATRAAAAVEQAKAQAAAEGAMHRLAAAAAAMQDLRAAAPLDGTVISTEFLGARIRFAAQDVGGLLDLNAAPEDALQRLLAATGAVRAGEIAALWHAARQEAGRAGFDAPEAALASLPAALAAEATPALAHATTWSGRAQVDPRTATAPALAAAAGIPLPEAQRFVAARTGVTGPRPPLPSGADLDALAVSDTVAARIEVRAETMGGGRAVLSATLRLNRSPRVPLTILSWQ